MFDDDELCDIAKELNLEFSELQKFVKFVTERIQSTPIHTVMFLLLPVESLEAIYQNYVLETNESDTPLSSDVIEKLRNVAVLSKSVSPTVH